MDQNLRSQAGTGPVLLEDCRQHIEMKKVWEAAAPGALPEMPDLDQAWLALQRQMRQQNRPVPAPNRIVQWFAPAMVLVGLLLTFIFYSGPVGSFSVLPGKSLELPLADRSMVYLNGESFFRLDPGFDQKNRDVRLEGEAFFSVKSGRFPFIVHTPTAEVQVVGTQFNVNARGNRVSVAVKEGLVEVRVKGEAGSILLHPGEAIAFESHLPVSSHPALGTDWREGIAVERQPLQEVCREIERRFDVRIVLADHSLSQRKVSGLFKGDSPEAIIASVCTLLDVEHTYEEGAFIIH